MRNREKYPSPRIGFGSGKTTLLNRILSEERGKRITVLRTNTVKLVLISSRHQRRRGNFEMSNGYCCTVRGDLIRVLGNLMKRRDKFDYVLVETTGLADPGPVAQTFFMDDEIRAEFSLDGIVTLVDAAHIEQQLGRSDESTEQIAFADVLVLNKTDLVEPESLDALEARLREMTNDQSHSRCGQSTCRDGAQLSALTLIRSRASLTFQSPNIRRMDREAQSLPLRAYSRGPRPTMPRVMAEEATMPLRTALSVCKICSSRSAILPRVYP